MTSPDGTTRERLKHTIAWISPPSGTPIQVWRRRILGAVLLFFAVFGFLAYIPSVVFAWQMQEYGVIVVDTIAYLCMLALVPARGLPYTLRASYVVLFPGALGVFFLVGFGFDAAGFLWLFSAPILAGILLGLRAGLRAIVCTAVVLLVFGILIPRGVFPWANAMPNALTMWAVCSVSLLILASVISVSIGLLFDGLGNEALAREAAEREAERLAGAVDQSDGLVLLLDVDGRIKYANRTARQLLGAAFDVSQLAHWPSWRSGEAWAGDVEGRGVDGNMISLSGTVSPVRDGDGTVTFMLATLRDVRRERALELRLQQGQRLEAIGTLAGGIAHDFNNLLQPILLNIESAQTQLDVNDATQPLLKDVRQSAERAGALVRRILTFTRAIEHERRPIDLGTLLTETERLVRTALPDSITLSTSAATGVIVEAEAGEMQQVLLNLATNSAHAMPAGGSLRLDVRVVQCAEISELSTAFPGRTAMACLSVADDGSGMDAATLERAFEPFFTTKGPGSGTGLGLAMVHGTVTALGGLVVPRSHVGVGTVMRVYLPLLQGTAHATPSAPTPAMSARRHHVLLVDDEVAVLNATSRLLQRLGYEVHPFSDPAGALAFMKADPRRADFVITDLSMPVMSGVELAQALSDLARAHQAPTRPIILTTGFLEHDSIERLSEHGITHVLSKPYSSAELQGLLDALMRAGGAA